MGALRSLFSHFPGPAGLFFSLSLVFLPVLLPAQELVSDGEALPAEDEANPDIALLRRAIAEEASPNLFSMELGDSDVSLMLSGYWKGTLSGSMGFALTPLGAQGASGDAPILFSQEADITLSLWIRERWFLEASFLDDYDINTYRMGYQGGPGEVIQYVGIGNTGLDYPIFPYLDLGGDSASSFGAYGRFRSGPLQVHSLIRYDAAAREERVYSGNRERSFSDVSVVSPLRGLSFVLPDENISGGIRVFIEDSSGSIRDVQGSRWREAAAGEYGVSARYGLLELLNTPDRRVAVYYGGGSYGLGTYGGSGFLADVQNHFNSGGQIIDLSAYPQSGGGAGIPGTVSINGAGNALVIYEPGTFSPFERQSRYRSPVSTAASVSLVTLSTGDRIRDYDVADSQDILLSGVSDIYTSSISQLGVYEIVSGGSGLDRRTAAGRWPLAAEFPEIYLPGSRGFTADIGIRFTNYGSAGAYSIGTDVIPGSVQVYRGGILDSRFSFNSSSGIVSLESPAGYNEIIRITYLKRSDERRLGSLAAGIGAVYDPDGPFRGLLSIGLRWNINSESFSEEGAASPGTVGLGGSASWDYDTVKTQVSLGLGFEQPDTTGLYRVAGMESSELILSMPSSRSFLSHPPADSPAGLFSGLVLPNRAPLVYRNYRDTNVFGSTTLMDISWSGASVVSGESGPYPVSDSSISSEVLAAEFNLNMGETWTGFQVPLGGDSLLLESAEKIIVPFRFYKFDSDPPAGIKIIAQFGAMPDEDRWGSENTSLIVERELYPDLNNHEQDGSSPWKLGIIHLDDDDRRKLADAKFMRIIIDGDPDGGNHWTEFSGRLLVSRPIVYGAGFRPLMVQDGTRITEAIDSGTVSVKAMESSDSSLRNTFSGTIKRLHPDGEKQRVLEVSWEGLKNSYDGYGAGVDGRSASIPFSNYRSMAFFFKGPEAANSAEAAALEDADLYFIVARGPSSIGTARETALRAVIPASAFEPGSWSKVELRYGRGEDAIYVDGSRVSGASLDYRPGAVKSSASVEGDSSGETGGQAGYIAAFITPPLGTALPDGTFSIDEIILEESAPVYRANLGSSVDYSRPGPIWSPRGVDVLSDFSIDSAVESSVRGDPFTPEDEASGGVLNRTNMEIHILDTRVTGNYGINTGSEYTAWDAGHGISRKFGPLSVDEHFYTAPSDKTMNHGFSLGLDTKFQSRIGMETEYEEGKLDRSWLLSLSFRPLSGKNTGVSFSANADWRKISEAPEDWFPNYAETWLKSWPEMIPDSGADERTRNTYGIFQTVLDTKPIGVDFSFDGRTIYSAVYNTTQSDSTGRLSFPFEFGSYSGYLRGERGFSRTMMEGTGEDGNLDIWDDSSSYFLSLKDSARLWTSLPVYSFFNPNYKNYWEDALPGSGRSAENSRFYDRLSFNIRFPNMHGAESLLIPRAFNTSFERSLQQSLDTYRDTFNLSGGLSFSALNIFGAFGSNPLFSFYQSDEFSHSLQGAVSLPKNEDPSWRINAEQNMGFFGFLGAQLVLTNTLSLTSSGWSESFLLDWTVPTKKSLLSTIYSFITGKLQGVENWPYLSELASQEYSQMRKETLELVVDATGDYTDLSVLLGHESIIRITGRLFFSSFAELNCTRNGETEYLSFVATIGTTLNVSF
ncbi:hypothetical protein LJC14_01300 [Treponema sp. OttesenSCG-928-L16]|nr:hypothetical protein [Treponema sp. OttesenSCG-928-L16]